MANIMETSGIQFRAVQQGAPEQSTAVTGATAAIVQAERIPANTRQIVISQQQEDGGVVQFRTNIQVSEPLTTTEHLAVKSQPLEAGIQLINNQAILKFDPSDQIKYTNQQEISQINVQPAKQETSTNRQL